MYWNLFRPVAFKIMNELLEGDQSLTELSISLEISKPTLQQRYLSDLIEMGVVEKNIIKTNKGREARYRLLPFHYQLSIDPERKIAVNFTSDQPLNASHPMLNQVKGQSAHDDLKVILGMIDDTPNLSKGIYIVVYGSVARGTESEKSDIDLMFLREEWTKDIKDTFINLLADIAYKLHHRISPQFKEFDELKEDGSAFADEIRTTGIIVFDGNGGGGIWEEMRRYRNISI